MKINWQQLKNLPVETPSGLKLGHVIDCELDTEAWSVEKIIVSPGLLKAPLMIAPTQVVTVEIDRLIV